MAKYINALGEECSSNPIPWDPAGNIRTLKQWAGQRERTFAGTTRSEFYELLRRQPAWIWDNICTCHAELPTPRPNFRTITVDTSAMGHKRGPYEIFICCRCALISPSAFHHFVTTCESCDIPFVNFPINEYLLCKGCA